MSGLSVAQTAELLRVSPHTVYRMVRLGLLPARTDPARTGSAARIFIDEEAVAAYQPRDHVPGIVLAGLNLPDDRFLTTAETARVLNCSPDHVRHLVAAGRLQASRFPGRNTHLKILPASVIAYLNRADAAA